MKNRRVSVIILAGMLSLLGGIPKNGDALEQMVAESGRTGVEQQTSQYLGVADGIIPDYENKGRTRIHIGSRSGKTAGTISLDPYMGSVEIFRYTPEGTETITLNPDSVTVTRQGHEVPKEVCKGKISPDVFLPKDCYVRLPPVERTVKGSYSGIMQIFGRLEEHVMRGTPQEVYLPPIK